MFVCTKLIFILSYRYLSFLGISLDNVKRCGFIMQVDDSQFVAHCFQAEPSAGALCKTIEAACKLRYQKCLDAHMRQSKLSSGGQSSSTAAGASRTSVNGVGTAGSPVATAIKNTIAGVFSKIVRGKWTEFCSLVMISHFIISSQTSSLTLILFCDYLTLSLSNFYLFFYINFVIWFSPFVLTTVLHTTLRYFLSII